MSAKQNENSGNPIPSQRRPVLLIITILYCLIVLGMPYSDYTSLIHSLVCFAPPQLLSLPLFISIIIAAYYLIRRRNTKVQLVTLALALVALPILYSFEINIKKPTFQAPNLRVLTCNILFINREVPELVDYIERNKVDLIFLQENKGPGSPAEYIHKRIPNYYLFADGSTAILSRWPLSETRSEVQRSNEARRIISAKVNSPIPFRAVTMHWSVPQIGHGLREFRESIPRQMKNHQQLIEFLKDEDLPLVFGGDFNNTPRHGLTRDLSQKFTNAFSTVGMGPGFTFSSDIPLVRIDHLYTNDKITPVFCSPGPSFRSDHFSLLGDFEILR